MSKVINVSNGVELFKIFKGASKANLSGKTLNVSRNAASEYESMCEALEQYGRSLVRERLPQQKRLVDANFQVADMIKGVETNNLSSLMNDIFSQVKKSGKSFEFILRKMKFVAEIVDGEPKIRFIELIKK